MTFLPIVQRELREGARRKSTRYIRLTVAAVALVISLFLLALMPILMWLGRVSGSTGFNVMTQYAFMLCVLAGIFITADCLSEEKREGTLGLLFLTDLRGYDVVLGKLISQLVYLGYALLAIIPAAALPMLFGGVTGGELWRISLALVNTLFFCLATGMFASAVCREAGRSMLLTGLLLVLICFIGPWIQSALNNFGVTSGKVWFICFSPAEAYSYATEANFSRAANRFWISLGVSHVLAWGLLALTSWRLPRVWQDKPLKNSRPSFFDLFGTSNLPARVQRRRELLDTEPLRWLIGEQRWTRILTWTFAIIWALGMVAASYSRQWMVLFAAITYGRFLLFPIKLLFAAQSTRFFVESRRSGAFELLLATPVNSRELVTAQWAMLRRVFLPPLLLILVSTILCGVFIMIMGQDKMSSRMMGLGIMGVFGFISLGAWFLDFFALGALGMWLALTMRKPHLATGATILFVLILPSIMCGIGFLVDIVLIAVFLNKLQTDFRVLVANQTAAAA